MYTTLFVVGDDLPQDQLPEGSISFETYLHDYPKLNEPKLRIINLCDTSRYLSQGYYCSLLAEARNHDVLPSVRVINALRSQTNNDFLLHDQSVLKVFSSQISANQQQEFVICMGEIADKQLQKIAESVYLQYPSPILLMTLRNDGQGFKITLNRCSLSDLNNEQRSYCLEVLACYFNQRWRKARSNKKFRWDLAMLVDPEEVVPPSNKGALSRFIKAGEKLGIKVHKVTAKDIQHINQYDGLFIRETTAMDHHTYRFACQAEEHGLVVMDDPNSILRCCNKVFLHDAFNYQNVPSLKTLFVSNACEESLTAVEQAMGYPVVLKLPESSFSKGVFKAKNREEFKRIIDEKFQESALVLAQEYLFTDYDWRIGVINGRAIYACRYYMARNHWQIYNHNSKRNFSGGFDALPTFEVPRVVLDAALKSAAVIGNGLYGVDIKMVDNQAYVIEVNDNPSIDHGVEDHYAGDELYMQIMAEFLNRFEVRGR